MLFTRDAEPEPEPEPEYFPGAGAGADQKCHGSASLLFTIDSIRIRSYIT